MIHLGSIDLDPGRTHAEFPFSLPFVRHFTTLTFPSPVTFFAGENGSGKSTLMDGLAAAVGSTTVGGGDIQRDPTLDPARRLGDALRPTWNRRTRRGFLRAEDFFRFTRRVHSLGKELQAVEYESLDHVNLTRDFLSNREAYLRHLLSDPG